MRTHNEVFDCFECTCLLNVTCHLKSYVDIFVCDSMSALKNVLDVTALGILDFWFADSVYIKFLQTLALTQGV